MKNLEKVFIIGTSAGGVSALHRILESIDASFSVPLIIIQHLPDSSPIEVGTIYHTKDQRPVVEIEDKMPIEANQVYFAPGGYHVLFERDGSFSLNQDEPVRFSRPSIDVTFESAAEVFGPKVTAFVLTGANSDGALGLVAVKKAGGTTVVQSPEDAEYPDMPGAAIGLQNPDFIVNLTNMPELMTRLQSGVSR